MHHLVLCRYMCICVAQCKMHYSYNALECNPMCNFQICNCIQMHYKMHCMFLQCIAMPPKQENGRQARAMGRRWLSKSLSYFKHLSLEWGGWLVGKRFLSTSSLSKSFVFYSNAKLSKLHVNATLECIGVAQTLNAVFVLHAKCIILSIALQCIQTRKMADKQVHWGVSVSVFFLCKVQQVVLECNKIQKSCRNTQHY